MHIEQNVDNEEVGDHSHVEDDGIDSLLRQAGTEASHASGIGWGHGRREGVGGAGWPAHLGGATNGYALASTLMFQAFAQDIEKSTGRGGDQVNSHASGRTAAAQQPASPAQPCQREGLDIFSHEKALDGLGVKKG